MAAVSEIHGPFEQQWGGLEAPASTERGFKTFLDFISVYVAGILNTGGRYETHSLRDGVSVERRQAPFRGRRAALTV